MRPPCQGRPWGPVCIMILSIALLSSGSPGIGASAMASTPSAAISFGQTVAGSIGAPGETGSYTFTASAGDVVLIGMSRITGSIYPQIRLYGPAGDPLGASDSPHAGLNKTLLSAGTYTILASDYYGTYTGDYGLYLQRLNNPGNASPIPFGQTLSRAISTPAQMDTYTFTASAGDVVLIGVSRITGSIYPQISLYGPAGDSLGTAAAIASPHAELSRTLPSAGTYTILASDYYGTYTGDYGLQRTCQ